MGLQENLRKQLALAVRSIQWSYAIFWSISSTQPGVLTWGDGYYNGDIKTRKTIQASEFNADQLGLQRSDLLRELYDFLSTEESNAQIRRPSASLSPEDLTDTEWYYLVCMSFVFNIGQGLPGKTLANGKPIWLCNAHYADSKLFCRSLLAKSAAIQTVVCFPFAGGVIELGITERVFEDPGLIQHVQGSFLEIPHPYASVSTLISINALDDENLIQTHLDRGILNTDFNAIVGCDEVNVCSPSDGTNRYRLNNQTEESFMIEGGLTEGASQIESLQLMEGNENDGVHDSMSSSECIFPSLVDPEKANPVHKGEKENEFYQDQIEQTPMGIQVDDVHYQSVLSHLLKTSHKLMMGPYFQNFDKDSSFICWKKEGFMEIEMLQMENSQRLLKKVLFQVARVHNGPLLDSREDYERKDGICAPQLDEIDSNHVLAERKRRERISERFLILESLVPSTSKVDKVSILDNTIEYIKELGKRVEGLESCKDFVALESRTRRKSQCIAEKSCDNYGQNNRPVNREKPLVNKRKASDIGEFEPETSCFSVKDNSNDDVTVSVMEKDCLIEIRCPWRECLLLQIIDTISRLHLDSHSVQSNNNDGTLSMTIKSKLKNSTVASAEIIKQALQRVVNKC